MTTIVVLGALLLLPVWALARMPADEQRLRRLERNEYRPLVLHLWHH